MTKKLLVLAAVKEQVLVPGFALVIFGKAALGESILRPQQHPRRSKPFAIATGQPFEQLIIGYLHRL